MTFIRFALFSVFMVWKMRITFYILIHLHNTNHDILNTSTKHKFSLTGCNSVSEVNHLRIFCMKTCWLERSIGIDYYRRERGSEWAVCPFCETGFQRPTPDVHFNKAKLTVLYRHVNTPAQNCILLKGIVASYGSAEKIEVADLPAYHSRSSYPECEEEMGLFTPRKKTSVIPTK